MDALKKLEVLGTSAQDDVCAPTEVGRARVHHPQRAKWLGGISYCTLPGGRRMPLLKTLFTNVCEYDCAYCEHRVQRDVPRVSFRPDELAALFMDLLRRRKVEGLFLTSGVTRRVNTVMDRMIDTAEILRKKYGYQGYLHLKILPGADPAHVERGLQLASRVSMNLEAPSAERLGALSSVKRFNEILERMAWIRRMQQAHSGKIPSGQITQFVVGPAGECDQEILLTSDYLYRKLDVRRAYYSAFHPVSDTPLEGCAPTPLLREHRLYQADWLLRFYGFSAGEIPFDGEGNLPRAEDPKMAWALRHPEWFPVEVLRADYETLLRVPGIGPVSARRIVERRREGFRDAKDLQRLGAVMKRAAPYLLLHGKPLAEQVPVQAAPSSQQLELWGER
jgi:putative DNA modification/repair radical SAM protein